MAKGKKKSAKKKGGNKIRKFFKYLGYTLIGLFVLSILITILYRWVNPPVTPLMVIRKVADGAPIEKKWVDIENISPYLLSSSVAAEDGNFLGHRGFDWGAIEQAMDENERGRRVRGGSTISQQTAKNVFLWPQRSWVRKGFEVYFTFLIETFWSKQRIMEVYLNVIEMGNGIYGCEKAAEIYFHKSAKNLSRREAALIAAIYPDPRHRNPAKPTAYLNARADKITARASAIGRIRFDDKTLEKAQQRYKKSEEKRKAKKKK